MQQNTHASQVHMEHSLRLITSWATNPTLVTWRKLKSYQTSFLTTMLYDWKSATRKNTAKNTNTWRLENILLNNQWISEKNQRGNLKISRSKWQQRYETPKHMGCSKNHSKRKVYSNKSPSQETRKSSNKQGNFISKAAQERRTDKT